MLTIILTAAKDSRGLHNEPRMKTLPILLLSLLLCLSFADGETNFASRFEVIISRRLDVDFFQDGPYYPFVYSGTDDANYLLETIHSMSNNVEEAVIMLPTVLTNEVQRNAFLTMAGHAGTNVFLRVWDELLDIAETNAVAVPPATIDSFCTAGTTPLDCYVVFFHEIPEIHLLLERTRDLFPSNSQRWVWYDRTQSGAVESEMRTYLIDSGEGLPWFAQ